MRDAVAMWMPLGISVDANVERIGRRAEQRRVVGRGDLRTDVNPERVADHATLSRIERPCLNPSALRRQQQTGVAVG